MRSAALILSLLCLSAAPPASEPGSTPAPAAARLSIHEASIDVSIQGPTTAAGGFALVGSGPKDAVLRWRIESPDGAAEPLRLLDASGDPVLVFMSPSSGRYRVVLTGQVASDGLDPFGESTHVVTVGNVPPVPPGPTPPGPTPPEPQPDAAPFPARGLTVLLLVDEDRKNELSANQRSILWGEETRDLLNSRTIEGADGKTNEWRVWYDTIDAAPAGEPWTAAMKAATEPPDALVKVAISNGKTGIVMPLNPEVTPAQFREILSKY